MHYRIMHSKFFSNFQIVPPSKKSWLRALFTYSQVRQRQKFEKRSGIFLQRPKPPSFSQTPSSFVVYQPKILHMKHSIQKTFGPEMKISVTFARGKEKLANGRNKVNIRLCSKNICIVIYGPEQVYSPKKSDCGCDVEFADTNVSSIGGADLRGNWGCRKEEEKISTRLGCVASRAIRIAEKSQECPNRN